MEKLEITKEFVMSAHQAACQERKRKIEKEFPSLFEVKLEVGKWYKLIDEPRFKFQFNGSVGESSHSGFNRDGEWVDMKLYIGYDRKYKICTEKEIKNALIAESEKRYSSGTFFIDLDDKKTKESLFEFGAYISGLSNETMVRGVVPEKYWRIGNTNSNCEVFNNGKWAEIVVDPNKEIKETISRLEKELAELKDKVK